MNMRSTLREFKKKMGYKTLDALYNEEDGNL